MHPCESCISHIRKVKRSIYIQIKQQGLAQQVKKYCTQTLKISSRDGSGEQEGLLCPFCREKKNPKEQRVYINCPNSSNKQAKRSEFKFFQSGSGVFLSSKLYFFLKKWLKENFCSPTGDPRSAIPCKLIHTSAFAQTFPGYSIPKEILQDILWQLKFNISVPVFLNFSVPEKQLMNTFRSCCKYLDIILLHISQLTYIYPQSPMTHRPLYLA